ncbi:GIY-YIG nuclease family protein [Clostridium sp. ZS2-4]|uniref:GIY-YIG nuclease family protein n=1 Tax=Clostridium sp. ZS2-4 TaxID=2987703 RepID=UPI00227A275B|nr:GIY-YIG nuclease family protein [Clostridium sp. ZS2-4]MCY6356208.1 GIY-YIG nuclease family protein [Clostridium sp. ZS2-4]
MAVFCVNYVMSERGLPTLFQYQYFTVDKKQRNNWDYKKLEQYLTKYKLCIDDSVIEAYKNNAIVLETLEELKEVDSYFIVSNNKGDRYQDEKQYIKCRIPLYVLKCMKKLFISTLVYDASKMEMPEKESIHFTFDTDSKTVTVMNLYLYEPKGNPYFTYARNAASSISVEAIGLDQYSVEKSKEIKDFYDRTQMSAWKELKQLENDKSIVDKAGVYMLYDINKNTFYVGKAKNLGNRILQHRLNPNDPIPDFTHYRYSVISGEYYEFLYLIENSAIHDIAWIIDMPAAKKYTPSLSKKINNINDCKMVNTTEHQTRKQD